MDRTYLFVPPEEKAEVQSLGAQWDTVTKRWFINSDDTPDKFSRWLPSAAGDEEFTINSTNAYVAAATAPCQRCHADTEVICIYCESGTASGEPLTRFTVCDIWGMDEDLARQLRPWPTFRDYANHCRHCGAPQDDLHLHSEPDSPFFDIPHAAPGSIALTPLVGTVRLSGDEHFAVE